MTEPNFELFFDLSATREVPADWFIAVADLKGSSAAIKQGKNREVNLIGAASVAAIRNKFGLNEIPYVFGGDGATFLVPPQFKSRVLETLKSVQKLVFDRLSSELRIGMVPVDSIKGAGASLRHGFLPVGKYEGFHFFRGNGLAAAESMIKSQDKNNIPAGLLDTEDADLAGLSCKLDPFESIRGRVLSVLVEPRVSISEEDLLFKEIIGVLCQSKSISGFKPISHRNEVRPWFSKNWKTESKLHNAPLRTIFENIVSKFLFRNNIKTSLLGIPSVYTDRLLLQSDWIKMDGTLRLVIETDSSEEERLRSVLSRLYNSGKIFFGVATSRDCVMTCHLQSAIDDRHTHFIDGGDGGLTRASIELKTQKTASSANSQK